MAASITFSELLATVLPDYMKNLADNFFVGTPTLAYLTKAGANIEVRSGERLVFPSIFQGGNSKWVTPYTQLEITNRRQIDGAQFTWRVLAGTTEITSTEKKASGPPCEIIPFVDAKLKVAETDCRQSFNTSIFNSGTDADTPVGLQGIASTSDPSVGAYGGISVSTYPLWKGYVNDTSKQLDFADMASGFYATSFHNDSPDLIITTQALYRTYEAIGSGQRRFDSKDTKFDAGFESLEYRGADVIWDRDCPDGDVFFVNTDHYKLYNLGGKGFEMIGPTHSINQPLLDVYAIAWHGTFACDERRTMGVLKSRTAG